MRALGLAVLALAAASVPAHAEGPAALLRVELPDGAAAARLPCVESDLQRKQDTNGAAVMCQHDGLGYAVMEGGFPVEKGWSTDYDAILAEASADKTAGTVTEARLGTFRAFTVESPATGVVGYVRIVEVKPGKLVTVLVQELRPGSLSDAAATAARAQARTVGESLEIAAK